MPRPNGHTVTVAHDGEDLQVGTVELDPGGHWERPTVDPVEPIGLHIVGEPAGAADARHEHGVLGLELLFRQEALYGGEDRVVTATRTPPSQGSLIVSHAEYAVVLFREVEKGTSAAHEAPPLGIF
jgi:hypothetical protein